MTTSFTQTQVEPHKRTRTGGVQVCIGNRMHFRQMKLARILNKLSINTEVESKNMSYNRLKFFMQWKILSIQPLPQLELSPDSKSIQKEKFNERNILKFEEKLNKFQNLFKQHFFEELKNNTIK